VTESVGVGCGFGCGCGSAAELRGALPIGVAWDYIAEPTEVPALLDRLGGLPTVW